MFTSARSAELVIQIRVCWLVPRRRRSRSRGAAHPASALSDHAHMAVLSAVPAVCSKHAAEPPIGPARTTCAGIFPDEGDDRRGWRRAGQAAADDLEQLRCCSAAGGPGGEDDGDRAGGYDAGHAKAEPQPPPVVVVVQLNRGIPPHPAISHRAILPHRPLMRCARSDEDSGAPDRASRSSSAKVSSCP